MNFFTICLWATIFDTSYCRLQPLNDYKSMERYMSECGLNIVRNYFDTKLPIAVQTPGMWHIDPDLETPGDILLQMLNHLNRIPLLTVGPKTIKGSKITNKVKPGSYIVLLPSSICDSQWRLEKMFRGFYYDMHNARGRLIIMASTCPKDNDELMDFLTCALGMALTAGYMNAIALIPGKGPTKSSRVYNISKIEIFGWLAEEQTNIHSWRIDMINFFDDFNIHKRAFRLKENLFPIKRATKSKDCFIKVRRTSPVFMEQYAKETNCELVYAVHAPYHVAFPIMYGTHFTPRECEFTYPYDGVSFAWYVPYGVKIPPWTSLIRALSPKMWLLVLISSAFGTISLLVLHRLKKINIGEDTGTKMILYAIGTHLGVGVNARYKGPASLLFVSTWLFYCLLINTAYQSSLLGLTITPGYVTPMNTKQEIIDSKMKMVSNIIFQDHIRHDETTFYTYCNNTCIEENLEKRDRAVFSFERQSRLDFLRDLEGHPYYKRLSETDMRYYTSMQVLGLSCLIYDKLNLLSHRAFVSGLYLKQTKDSRIREEIMYSSWAKVESVLALKPWHLQGAFYLLAIGLILGFLAFIFENIKMLNLIRCFTVK